MDKIRFNEETHEYFIGDKKLISVTQLMRKHGLAPDYASVDPEVLKAAAERGSLIHKEIEEYNKLWQIGFTDELSAYVDYIEANNVQVEGSEFILHNDIVAGTADLLLKQDDKLIIADIKTTYVLHKDAISWQLSIYAYLLNKGVEKGQAFHLRDGNLNVVEIPLKPLEEVEKLLQCEREGIIYKQDVTAINNAKLEELAEVEKVIKAIEIQKKEAEAKAQDLRAALIEAMKANGVITFENDDIRITYVAPTTRESVDSAKLKKDLPEIAAQYMKTSTVKESLRITLKGE